jgi:hypothetical protein
MIYKSSDKLPIKKNDCNYYFLAGSIDFNQLNPWREILFKKASQRTCFFDPTRINHNDLNNAEMKQHINWELDALELSDQIILNFLPDAKSPISLLELGLYAKSDKLIVVCPDEFYQKRYIKTLCEKYSITLFQNLNQVVI